MNSRILACLIQLHLLGLTLAQLQLIEWTAAFIPNPMVEPKNCKISQKGYVCNPNMLLSNTHVTNIGKALDGLTKDTSCPCKDACPADKDGFVFSVLVVRAVTLPHGVTAGSERHDAALMEFADDVRKKWTFGTCDNDGLIVVDYNHKHAFTSTGSTTKAVVNTNCSAAIDKKFAGKFQNRQFSDGIIGMINEYHDVITEKRCVTVTPATHKTGYSISSDEQSGSTDHKTLGIVLGIVFGILILAVVVGILYLVNKRRKQLQINKRRQPPNQSPYEPCETVQT